MSATWYRVRPALRVQAPMRQRDTKPGKGNVPGSYVLMFTGLAAGGASGTSRATLLMDPATFVTAVMLMVYIF